ncbi:MAG: hypothetical protein V1859_01590 [archaeon]
MFTEIIDHSYLEKIKKISLPDVIENNTSLLVHKKGNGVKSPSSFNIKVYHNKKGRLTLVTTDKLLLDELISGKEREDLSRKRIIMIDDSGWGFPLGGVLCGAYDSETEMFHTKEINVSFFQGNLFAEKAYLDEYAKKAFEIIHSIHPLQESTIIRICTGYINIKAKDDLREAGFQVIIDKIGEPLQSWLEMEHKKYIIRLVGRDIYFDPKETEKSNAAQFYQRAVKFAEQNKLEHLLKNGWHALQDMSKGDKEMKKDSQMKLDFTYNNRHN